MPFEFTIKNNGEEFRVSLARSLSEEELGQVSQFAVNILSVSAPTKPVYGPAKDVGGGSISGTLQTVLGERPKIAELGSEYKEPSNGVRLKMVAFPTGLIIQAVKALRDITQIRMMACREIVCGNMPCPILSVEIAVKVLEVFKHLGIYAKMVDANSPEGLSIAA